MDLQGLFDTAVANSKLLTKKPGNETLLKLYALYKQAEKGDQDGTVPENEFDFVARAKYKAWVAMKGKTKAAAQQEYIDLVKSLQ
ncbi:MAG: acyl-CoA-binding protein [Bacteroidota bacterium]